MWYLSCIMAPKYNQIQYIKSIQNHWRLHPRYTFISAKHSTTPGSLQLSFINGLDINSSLLQLLSNCIVWWGPTVVGGWGSIKAEPSWICLSNHLSHTFTQTSRYAAMFNHVCLSTQKKSTKKGVSGSLSLTKDSTSCPLVPKIQPTPPTTKKFTAKWQCDDSLYALAPRSIRIMFKSRSGIWYV